MKKILFALALTQTGCHFFGDNFHEIEPGIAYRSAQMDGEDLKERIEEHQIRSVLNLRGKKPHKEWYQEEAAVCEELGVTLYNVRMSARRLPYKTTIAEILDVFDNCRYPLLIHCKAGADRTGLVSALYRIHEMYHDVDRADDELSILYGHLSVPEFAVYNMDQFLIYYKQSKAEDLREFLKTYDVEEREEERQEREKEQERLDEEKEREEEENN